MTYVYKCEHCGKEITINKPMSESDRKEFCEICENELKRIYTAGSILTGDGFKR